MALCNVSFQCLTSGFMQMASGFMQMTSGFMQMASGFMQMASGFMQMASGFMQMASGFMQMASGFMQMTSGFMQMASGFMQLATTGCWRNILHCHCLFEGKCYLCIGMGITILKIIIWGGISRDMRSEVTFLALLTCHRKTKSSFHMSNDNHSR